MRATVTGHYAGTGTKTLSVDEGTQVEVIQITTEAWTYVKDLTTGKRGFVPTELLSIAGQDEPLQAAPEGVQLREEAGQAGCFRLKGRIVTDYERETPEALSVSAGCALDILQVGLEWTFVQVVASGEKGFLPTALLRVGDQHLLQFARANQIEVLEEDESSYTETEEDDSQEARAPGSGGGGQWQQAATPAHLDPKGTAIPLQVWDALPPAQQHRQRMIYGLIHREREYNKDMWKFLQIARDFERINGRRQYLSADESEMVFMHVDAMYATSNKLLASLVKRQRQAHEGVIDAVADLLAERVQEFEQYTVYSSMMRVEQGTRVLREYSAQFDHPFSLFMLQLPQGVRLPELFAAPREYMFLWPLLIRNLQRDTSKSRQRQEYRRLRKLHEVFSRICASLLRAEQDASAGLSRRLENYDDIRPHIEGRRLLRETAARAMSSEGTNFGNYVFLFDSCVVFARKHSKLHSGRRYKALKKLKMDRLRIVDVERANVILRYNAEKYFLAFPTKADAIEWSQLMRHKSYRGKLEVDTRKDFDWKKVALPKREKAYEAHLERVAQMQQHIAKLMSSETLALEDVSSLSEAIEVATEYRDPKRPEAESSPPPSKPEKPRAPLLQASETTDEVEVSEEESWESWESEEEDASETPQPTPRREEPVAVPSIVIAEAAKSCSQCGTEMKTDARFCKKCGEPTDASALSPTPAQGKKGRATFRDSVHVHKDAALKRADADDASGSELAEGSSESVVAEAPKPALRVEPPRSKSGRKTYRDSGQVHQQAAMKRADEEGSESELLSEGTELEEPVFSPPASKPQPPVLDLSPDSEEDMPESSYVESSDERSAKLSRQVSAKLDKIFRVISPRTEEAEAEPKPASGPPIVPPRASDEEEDSDEWESEEEEASWESSWETEEESWETEE